MDHHHHTHTDHPVHIESPHVPMHDTTPLLPARRPRLAPRWLGYLQGLLVSVLLYSFFFIWLPPFLQPPHSASFPPSPCPPPQPRPPGWPWHGASPAIVAKCKALDVKPGPPPGFAKRTRSDRAQDTPPVLIRNATLWTGEEGGENGEGGVRRQVDIWLTSGLISRIESAGSKEAEDGTTVIEAAGRWVTPGLIDVHIHAGVDAVPALQGSNDVNSHASTITPALRSIDALNFHDLSFVRIAAGGVTTGLVLPGSANNVGGQAFPIKLGRQTPTDARHGGFKRIIDPPTSLVGPGEGDGRVGDVATGMNRTDGGSAWRYMKMACGENARRRYSLTRMDEALAFRTLFDKAQKVKAAQDGVCEMVKKGMASEMMAWPEDLELEAVVDVLRGKVKVNTHCYTATDLESFVRHTNEFKFPLAAFHHAHEAYLVPSLLKQTYGGTPAVALFSLNGNYKLEAIAGSPFTPAILASHGITVHIKSDHPVTDSRRVLAQAAQSHHFGFGTFDALAGLTSRAAKTLGLEHRVGYAKVGHDADLVLWDDHMLALGAHPLQVLIDGVPQLNVSLAKEHARKAELEAPSPPKAADFAAELQRVNSSGPAILAWEASASPEPRAHVQHVEFRNVSAVYARPHPDAAVELLQLDYSSSLVVQASNGEITYAGACSDSISANRTQIDLKGGVILPGLTSFGAELGMADITSESSTSDSFASFRPSFAALTGSEARPLARAVDVLQWGGNDLARTYAAGVARAIVAPRSEGFVAGLSVRFNTGATDAWEENAVLDEEVALHVNLGVSGPKEGEGSEAEQIGTLRALLRDAERVRKHDDAFTSRDDAWARVARGELPLVVRASKAERLGALVRLKQAYPRIRLVLAGAEEAAHGNLPRALADAGVAVLLKPNIRTVEYDSRRALPGPPLSMHTTLGVLREAGVKTALLIEESWETTTLLWDAVTAAKDAGGLSKADIVNLVSRDIEDILGLKPTHSFVAYDADPFKYGARPVALSSGHGVDLMDDIPRK